jgi:hypothetical protein
MNQLAERLAAIPDAQIDRGPSSWTMRLSKSESLHFEIQVPYSVLEWYASVRDASGTELWSDWMDYAGYVPKNQENPKLLAAQMERDIEWFVTTLAAAEDFRVTSRRELSILPRRAAEWLVSGEWRLVALTPE